MLVLSIYSRGKRHPEAFSPVEEVRELRQVTHLSQTSVSSLVKKIQYGWGEVSVNNALTGQAWGSHVYLPKPT